jgi:hypothetical protein
LLWAFIITVQVLAVPLQAPFQPEKASVSLKLIKGTPTNTVHLQNALLVWCAGNNGT